MEDKCDHGWEAVIGSPANDWLPGHKGTGLTCPSCGGEVVAVKVAV